MEITVNSAQAERPTFQNNKSCTNGWRTIPTCDKTPSQRSLHVGVTLDDSFYVFGGYDGTQRTNDFYRFNFQTNLWSQIACSNSPPSSRDRHTAVVYDKCIYIFGGFDGVNRVNDFHSFNVDTNLWKEIIHKGILLVFCSLAVYLC